MFPPAINGSSQAAGEYRQIGQWRPETWLDVFSRELEMCPTRVMAIDDRSDLTVAELWTEAQGLACWLVSKGIGAGDVISFQLPNWREALIVDAAAALIGAISNPIATIYREAELSFMLGEARSRVLVVPIHFRGADYLPIAERLKAASPTLQHLLFVRGTDQRAFDRASLSGPAIRRHIDPDLPRTLMFTSGTTGHAKGCVHSYNTLRCELENAARFWKIERDDAILMPSPVTHITGYLYGISLPLTDGAKSVLMERWDPQLALRLIERHKIVGTCSATPFLTELVEAMRNGGTTLPSMIFFACGGAPVSPTLISDSTRARRVIACGAGSWKPTREPADSRS